MSKAVISQDYMEKVLKIRPDSLLFARYAYNLLMAKKVSEAQKIALDGVDKSPDFATGRFVLALCLIEQKEYESAINQLFEVLKIEPTHQSALAKAAQILSLQDNVEESHTLEDYLVRLNPKSRFLGKVPHRNSGNDTLFEILGGTLEWKDFASESYLNDKKEIEAQSEIESEEEIIANIENAESMESAESAESIEESIEDDIESYFITPPETPAKTETPQEIPQTLPEEIPEIEVPEIKIPEIKIPEVEIPELEIEISEVKTPEVEKKTPEVEIPEVKIPEIEIPPEQPKPKDVSIEEKIENELAEAMSEEINYDDEISNTILAELEGLEQEEPYAVETSNEKELEELAMTVKANEFSDFKHLIEESIASLPLENPLPPKKEVVEEELPKILETTEFSAEEIQRNIEKAKEENILEELSDELGEELDSQMSVTFDDSFESYRQEKTTVIPEIIPEMPKLSLGLDDTAEYTAEVLENVKYKLNEEEQEAEPVSEQEAFAYMLAKNGTDLLPNHILTPTFAQIYLEQGQPFLAKQIYERLLSNDCENDEYAEKLKEVNKAIEMMKNGETFVVESKIKERKTSEKKTKVTKKPKKSLKGKRIKKEIREMLKEKHSANSKEESV